jgi:hypothetical protein
LKNFKRDWHKDLKWYENDPDLLIIVSILSLAILMAVPYAVSMIFPSLFTH